MLSWILSLVIFGSHSVNGFTDGYENIDVVYYLEPLWEFSIGTQPFDGPKCASTVSLQHDNRTQWEAYGYDNNYNIYCGFGSIYNKTKPFSYGKEFLFQ
jgi:hypothetical protein